MTQNPRNEMVGLCYINTDVSGRRSAKPRECRILARGSHAMWHGVTMSRGTLVPRIALLGAMVATRVCHDVQFLMVVRFRL